MAIYGYNLKNILQREVPHGFKSPLSTCAYLLYNQEWRERKGLPQNPNKDKMLLDLPDYSFVDGRPTPYGSRQKQRIEKQRYYTAKIISLTEEIDTAERLHQEKLAKQKMLAEQRIKAKLRPKGEKTITS